MNRDEAAEVCRALSDLNRLCILEKLTTGEKCGCELLRELQVSQPTLSHHMKVLCDCALVTVRKEAKWNHYRINEGVFNEFKEYITKIGCIRTSEPEGCC